MFVTVTRPSWATESYIPIALRKPAHASAAEFIVIQKDVPEFGIAVNELNCNDLNELRENREISDFFGKSLKKA